MKRWWRGMWLFFLAWNVFYMVRGIQRWMRDGSPDWLLAASTIGTLCGLWTLWMDRDRRWLLRATPLDSSSEVSVVLAEAFNQQGQMGHRTRKGAAKEAFFYTTTLGLPVQFWILDAKEVGASERVTH